MSEEQIAWTDSGNNQSFQACLIKLQSPGTFARTTLCQVCFVPEVQVLESTLARVTPGARSLARCSLSFSWESECLKEYVVNEIDSFVQTSTGIYELVGVVSWGRDCAKSFGVYADLPCKFHFNQFHLLSSISTFNQFHHLSSISHKSMKE